MQTIRFRSMLVLPLVLYCLPSCSAKGTIAQGGGTAAIGGTALAGGSVATTSSSAALGGTTSTQGTELVAGGTATVGGTWASGGHAVVTGGRPPATGGAVTGGKAAATGGVHVAGGDTSSAGSTSVCSEASLIWKSANKTNYTSYPDPGSEECIEYNGCTWAGQFAACDGTKPEAWVAAHDIVAAFPDFQSLRLHDLCLRKGQKFIVVTVLDTCGDSDCNGCCTKNKGSADQLIDLESYTNARWGVPGGPIEWADLGPTKGPGCGE